MSTATMQGSRADGGWSPYLAGALAASLTDGSFRWEKVPPTWQKRFGPSLGKRALGAFLSGIVAMIGARMADGCPSGHGLSGLMQLSVSGFVVLACFFGAGIVVARRVYGGPKEAVSLKGYPW